MIDAIAPSAQPDSPVNQAGNASWPHTVLQSIQNAAARTGVDFSYLMNKAMQESGLNPNAKSGASSATGLFQFTSQTWLRMVKNYGAEFGLGSYASHISIDASGVAHVDNSTDKQAILGLRKDPGVSSLMAGELDKENLDSLQQNVGGKIGGTELYLAHFLGAGGASDFLNEMHANPGASAASILPAAASANQSLFYNSAGEPRSLSQIYQHFAQKFNQPPSASEIALASAQTGTTTPAAPSYVTASNPPYAGMVTNGIQNQSSSLFATMVLAQMGTADPSSSFFPIPHENDHDRMKNSKTQNVDSSMG